MKYQVILKIKNIIADAFCQYYINVGPTLANEINTSAREYTDYISGNLQNSIFINLITRMKIEKQFHN